MHHKKIEGRRDSMLNLDSGFWKEFLRVAAADRTNMNAPRAMKLKALRETQNKAPGFLARLL